MGADSNEQGIDLVNKGIFVKPSNDRGWQCLLHECSAYSTVSVEAMFYLKHNDNLIVHTRYEMPSDLALERRSLEAVTCLP